MPRRVTSVNVNSPTINVLEVPSVMLASRSGASDLGDGGSGCGIDGVLSGNSVVGRGGGVEDAAPGGDWKGYWARVRERRCPTRRS